LVIPKAGFELFACFCVVEFSTVRGILVDGLLNGVIIKMCSVMHKSSHFCALKNMNKIKAKEIILEQKKKKREITFA